MVAGFLLYGATGYTGTLIAEACAARGLAVTLAGRREERLRPLAERLGLPHRVVDLADAARLDRALDGVGFVLHCAGPFSRTSTPMVDACLRTRRHYLDITGEIEVFEACARRDREAKERGVMLLPGVGFDVVPSDCVAAHVKRRLPSATRLELCIAPSGSLSHGTAATTIEHLHRGGAVRRGGRIVPSRPGALQQTFDLGGGRVRPAVSMPWGDVATAWYSTQIPDITVYFALSAAARRVLALAPLAQALLRVRVLRRFLQSLIPTGGPSAEERVRGKSTIVAEASDDEGHKVVARLRGPEGYVLTVETALLCAERVLAGRAPAGFQTPSLAYGADLVLEVSGVSREDIV